MSSPYKALDARVPIDAIKIKIPKRCWRCSEVVSVGKGFVFKETKHSTLWTAEHFDCPENDGLNQEDWY